MTHPVLSAARPLVIAHRGACAYAPENTLSAFRLALEQGADGIELDAKLSTDGRIVVMHDSSLKRTTGVPVRVSAATLPEIRALDAGSWFSPAFANERVPSLEEVFQALGGQLLIDIEISNYTTPRDGLAYKIAKLVRQYRLEESVFFSSFLPHNLSIIRRELPGVPAGILALRGGTGRLSRGWVGRRFAPQLVAPEYSDISPDYVAREHGFGRKVLAWTVNQPEHVRRLLAGGVNGIITDDPLMVRKVMEEIEGGR